MRRRRRDPKATAGGKTKLPGWIMPLARYFGRVAGWMRKDPASSIDDLTYAVLRIFSRDGSKYIEFIKMGRHGYRFEAFERLVDPEGRGHYWGPLEGIQGEHKLLDAARKDACQYVPWCVNEGRGSFKRSMVTMLQEVFRRLDPERRILGGAPTDEYDVDARGLSESIRPNLTKDELLRVVTHYWGRSYGERDSELLQWYRTTSWEEPVTIELQTLVEEIWVGMQSINHGSR